MSRETYYRWISHSASREPAWFEGERHVAELSVEHIRSPDGALRDWTLIDEVLGLEEATDDPATELVAVRSQLVDDLDELRWCWQRGRNDATTIAHADDCILLSGGWPGPDEEYPTSFTGCLARLVGSGAALAAGFTTDDLEDHHVAEKFADEQASIGSCRSCSIADSNTHVPVPQGL